MFTGIIEETGAIRIPLYGASGKLSVFAGRTLDGTEMGDSIAVNGVCLTAVELGDNFFNAEVSSETASRSTLSFFKPGRTVNLERAARVGQAVGGHIVQGHVDEVSLAKVVSVTPEAKTLKVTTSPALRKYLVEKGSIAIDGISLTISKLNNDGFEVALIPHTVSETNLKNINGELPVNLEVDMFAKYIYKYISVAGGTINDKSKVNEAFLAENGFI